MRTALLASAATVALMFAHPGFAQSTMTDIQPRAIGQQNPSPADVTGPTDPTVPAELQVAPRAPAADPLLLQPRQRGGELIDQSQMPLQTAQNQVPPDQSESMPGQPATPKGPAANQEGQTQPGDPGTPVNPTAPPGMPAYIPPGLTPTLPGQPAAPHGQGEDQQGQATPDQRGDLQPDPTLMAFQVAQNDTMPAQTQGGMQQPPSGGSGKMTEGYNAAGSEPLSRSASNIDASDSGSRIAPRLPTPPGGPDASPADLLHAARDALGRNQTGEAQEALERAETRLLDRSTEPGNANAPDDRDAVKLIGDARQALAHSEMAHATQDIDSALQRPAVLHFAAE